MSNINLSPKHGVNPTMPICFWCEQEKNEIALLGLLPNDAGAPRHCVLDYEPCDACREKWDAGVVILEVTATNPHEIPPIHSARGDFYPTGRYMVFKPQALEDPTLTQGIMLTEEFQKLYEEAH